MTEPKKEEEKNPLDVKHVVVDVQMVAQLIVRVAKAKSPRTVKDAMTVTELRALADAALLGIKSIPSSAKPNGLTDEGRIIHLLEADIAHTHLRLEEAIARVTELEEKLAMPIEER